MSPVADIVARRTRNERRPSGQLLADLEAISAMAAELGVVPDPVDVDGGWTTDDLNR
ncbi:MAG: hypothetical protein H7323_05140 [Frankiales bacterium]|nr:hypothetical protein [Frankiales bacterium]